jgi:hypothetical protein
MVTIAVIKIKKISNMLPSHIKHNVAMIWSHLIFFNLFNSVEFCLVCYSWYSVQDMNQEVQTTLGLWIFETLLAVGFLMQALIARVLVMFSKDSNDPKAKEVWACVTHISVVGRILTRGEALEAMEEVLI